MAHSALLNSIRECFVYKCFCCSSSEINHGRLTPSSDGSPHPSIPTRNEVFDNPVIQIEDLDNFTMHVLDTPELHWEPQLRLRQRGDGFIDVDLSDGNRVANKGQRQATSDSKSLSSESGYGPSIEESLESCSGSKIIVGVRDASTKATYKLVVQDQTKCWFVFRRQLDFVYIQEYIKKQIDTADVGDDLPVEKRLSAEELQHFVQRITSDERVLQLPKVREFLHLDRYRSSSESSGSSSDDSNSLAMMEMQPPNSKVILNPKTLPPLRIPTFKKKPQNVSGQSNTGCSPELGCEEKKMVPRDFEFLTVVGKGSFGKVFLARKREDNKVFAVKVLNKKLILRKNETAHVLSERSVLTRVLHHPYIVQLHYAFTTDSKIFFVLDYVNGGELFYHLQKERSFPEDRTRFYGAEICCALTYMHSKGIVYRDLKPENILLDKEGHVMLTDFGLCKEGIETSSSRTSTFCGTPEYLAPEVILKKPYTRSIDWWTYGAVLYEMLYGLPPFYYKDTRTMYDAIIHKPLKLKPTISHAARSLLSMLLQKSPSKRLGSGCRDGQDIKSHSFFSSICWTLIEERGIAPPFIPQVTGEEDTSNIDPIFTREVVCRISFGPGSGNASPAIMDSKAFRGFSYVCPVHDEQR